MPKVDEQGNQTFSLKEWGGAPAREQYDLPEEDTDRGFTRSEWEADLKPPGPPHSTAEEGPYQPQHPDVPRRASGDSISARPGDATSAKINQHWREKYNRWATENSPENITFKDFPRGSKFVEDRVGPGPGGMSFPEFTVGLGEAGTEMITGFAASLPALMMGLDTVAFDRDSDDPDQWKKAANRYVEEFMKTQEYFTWDPRSEAGKRVSKGIGDMLEGYAAWGKKHISDPAYEAGFPGIAAWSQTGIEALPILGLMRRQGPKIGGGPGGPGTPRSPAFKKVEGALNKAESMRGTPDGINSLEVAERLINEYPSPLETRAEFGKSQTKSFGTGEKGQLNKRLANIKAGIPQEWPTAPAGQRPAGLLPARPGEAVRGKPVVPKSVPRETLPPKADPMAPKPVGERSLADIQPRGEPLPQIPEKTLRGPQEPLMEADFGRLAKEPVEPPPLPGETPAPAAPIELPESRMTREEFLKDMEPEVRKTEHPVAKYQQELRDWGKESEESLTSKFDELAVRGTLAGKKGKKTKAEKAEEKEFTEIAREMITRKGIDWPVDRAKLIDEHLKAQGKPKRKRKPSKLEKELKDRSTFDVQIFGNRLPAEAKGDKWFQIKVTPEGTLEFYIKKAMDKKPGKKPVFIKTQEGKTEIGPGLTRNMPMPWGMGEAIKEAENFIEQHGGIESFKPEPIEKHLDPLETPEDKFDYSVNPEKLKQERYGKKAKKPSKARQVDVTKDSVGVALAKGGGMELGEAKRLGIQGFEGKSVRAPGSALWMIHKGKKAMEPDRAVEYLRELGYPIQDINSVLDALADELGGDPKVHPQYDYDAEIERLHGTEYEKYLEEQRKPKGGPGDILYTGIPVEAIENFIKNAVKGVKDALGMAEEGVSIEHKPLPRKQHQIQKALRSPGKILSRVDGLPEVHKSALAAEDLQNRTKGMFGRRLKKIRQLLRADSIFQYSKNKKELAGLRMDSDLRARDYTADELRKMGVSENVVKAYRLTRSLYNKAYNMERAKLEKAGRPVPEYLKGYQPHYFHNWFVTDLTSGEILSTGRTVQEATKQANETVRKEPGREIRIYFKPRHFDGEEMQAAVIGDRRYMQMLNKLVKRFGITPEEGKTLLGGPFKKGGKGKTFINMLDRKGITGWVKDFDWMDHHYFNMLARDLAMDKFDVEAKTYFEKKFGEFDKAWGGDALYVKNYMNDVLGVPTAAEQWMDNMIKTNPAFRDLARKYGGERPSQELASVMSMGITVLKLGLYNYSAAAVNTTQLTNVYAILGARDFGPGLAAALKAKKDIVAGNYKVANWAKSPNKDLWVLKKLAIEQQQGYSGAEEFTPGWFVKSSLVAFREAEFLVRSTAALGAFRKFMRENKKMPWKERREKALMYAEEVNYRANFNYGVEDAVSFMRRSGPPGQLAFKFWPFAFKEADFMLTMKGAEHARFWIPWLILAGYMGVPFIQDLNELGEQATGTNVGMEAKNYLMEWVEAEEDDANRKRKQAFADTVMYGIGSQLGLDVSYRLGMGDALRLDVGGVFISTYVKPFKNLWQEEYAKAFKNFATSPGNLRDAIAGEDPKDRRGRLKVKITTRDRFYLGLGFRPLAMSHESDKARYRGYKNKQKRREEMELITKYLDAVDANDTKKMKKLELDLLNRNIDPARWSRERIMRENLTQHERSIWNTPRKDWPDAFKTYGYGKERPAKKQ